MGKSRLANLSSLDHAGSAYLSLQEHGAARQRLGARDNRSSKPNRDEAERFLCARIQVIRAIDA
jgi:hypothetical protein